MKTRAKSLTARQAALVVGFLAGLLVMAIGIANLHGHILTSLMSQAQMPQSQMPKVSTPKVLEPQVPVPLATGVKDSHSRLGTSGEGSQG